jgi:uncharacterized membrane protein YgaE (UPF0421/DUF939 family)/DNA-binding HxlR family transcriptional regulator
VVLAGDVSGADFVLYRTGCEWLAMATHPPSQLVKHGLRFSIGAALLTGLFGERGDLLDNYAYPIFGYVSVVIEPSSGRAITAGLGRLGGSALGGFIAATLIYAFGLEGSSYYIIPPLTFILASLICETYRWQAAYSQATLIGTFIAMRAVGTSAREDIWLYVQSRVVDNWIGVMIGIIVTLLFWPQESRRELVKRTRQFLQQMSLGFAAIVNRLSPNFSSDPSAFLSQLTHLTQTSQKTLATASTEFQGEAILEENWSAILSSQTQLTRQLTSLNNLLANQSGSITQFVNDLNQFKDHLAVACDHLNVSLTVPDSINSDSFVALQQDVAEMEAKLNELRTTGAIETYSVIEAVQCFQLLELCRQLTQSLQTLQGKLHDRMNAAANQQRHPILTLPKWKPVSYQRVIEIVGMGTAIGMILAIINHIEFPFPSAYAKVASLVVVGGVIFLTQPTRGKAIAMSIAATLCLYIVLFWIYLIGTAFGFSPVSSGLLYFLIYMSCAVLGFTPIARIGAILAADMFAKDIFPFFEQGLQAAAGSILAAVIVSLLITHLFMGGSVAEQFTQSLAQTYRQLGQLYQLLLAHYLQDQNTGAEAAKLKQILAPTLAKHPLIFKVAGIEQGTSALAAQQKSLWNVWLNHEQQLFTQLGNLEEYTQTPPPDWIKQQFLLELETIAQQTTDRFNQIATQITAPVEQSISETSLTSQIESLEQQLLSLRSDSRDYPLTPLISFSATFMTLKTIADHLDQITNNQSEN